MIKACFFDMDGTLLSHTTHTIPSSTLDALTKLKQKGIKIILATGRHPLELQDLPGWDIEFDAYVLLNGNLCLNNKKEVVFKNPINKEDSETLVSLFHKKAFPLMLVEEKRFYCNFINSYVEISQAAISSPIPEIGEYHGDPIYQALPYLEDNCIAPLLKNCTITRWHQYGLDINAKGEGKVEGIKFFLQHFNIAQNECMAFGDGENDEAMLNFAHIGVAMGNGHPSILKHADFISKHIDEDGIYYACKKFNLI